MTINLCDKNGDCTVTHLEPQNQCRFYGINSNPRTYCDHYAWSGGCLCREAVEDAKNAGSRDSLTPAESKQCDARSVDGTIPGTNVTRDGAVVAHQSHKLIHAGSSPAPATSHEQDNGAGGSGEANLNVFRPRYPVHIKISWNHFLYRNRLVWTLRFFYYDLFDAKYPPQNGLTRWQMFKADFKFIWR